MTILGLIAGQIQREEQMYTLGDFIHNKRGALGLSQTELAKRVGVHKSNVSRVEAGEQFPRERAQLERYAKALKCDTLERDRLLEMGGYSSRVLAASEMGINWTDKYFLEEVRRAASDAFHREGNIRRALCFQKWLVTFIPENSDSDLMRIRAVSLLNLGWTYQALGKEYANESIVCLKEAESIAVRIGERVTELDSIHGQGISCANTDRYGEALKYYRKALLRSEGDVGAEKFRAMLLRDALIAHAKIGDSGQAETDFLAGRELLDRLGDECGTALLLEARARAKCQLGDHKAAIEDFGQAAEFLLPRKDLQPLHRMIVLKTATQVYLSAGDIPTGIQFASQALALGRSHDFNHQIERLNKVLANYGVEKG